MQVLQLNKKISTFCGMCSEESDNRSAFRQIMNFVIIVSSLSLLGFSSLYFAADQLNKGDIVEFLFGFLSATPSFITLGTYITITYRRKDVRIIFHELQEIVDQSKFHTFENEITSVGLLDIFILFHRRKYFIHFDLYASESAE